MNLSIPPKNISLREKCFYTLLPFLFISINFTSFAQPSNDNCGNAKAITIPNSGFALGIFNSSAEDISLATIQTGETFAPAILVAGQNKKSIWYKFTLPTSRTVRVTLGQPGTAVTAGDAGFAVYKTNSCIPLTSDISTKLTPIATFGNTFHPCVDPGDYLVQVSSKVSANGPLYIQLQLSDSTGAVYDHPSQAYNFGIVNTGKRIDYAVNCQSTEDANEICAGLQNYQKYNKSTWHTFTTSAYFDYIAIMLSSATGAYFTNSSTYEKFGYNLYKGNILISPLTSLTTVNGCDSIMSNGNSAGYKMYKCTDLEPNTTYTLQLFFHETFNANVRVGITVSGTSPTHAPEPLLASMPLSNKLGILPSNAGGVLTTSTDYLACNSRHILHPCSPSMPAAGIVYNGKRYNLSTFYTFTLSSTSRVDFSASGQCGPALLMTLYNQNVTNNCSALDTATIISSFFSNSFDCMSPGTYTMQISGIDSTYPSSSFNYSSNGSSTSCLASNLGSDFKFNVKVFTRNALNDFSLNATGAVDTINRVGTLMQPLQNGVQYQAKVDTFGCQNTVRPADTTCNPANNKVMYRQFALADSGIVTFTGYSSSFQYKLYQGDASALATAQSSFSFPSLVTGLNPVTKCMSYSSSCIREKVCVTPGYYTFTTFGSDNDIGISDRPAVKFDIINTRHFSPQTAQDLGNVLDTLSIRGLSSMSSDIDYFSCKDNALSINGYQPCSFSNIPATKAIYRQFYLSDPSLVNISNQSGCNYGGLMTMFSGKATDGLAGLIPLPSPWRCFANANINNRCDQPLAAGWYTVVSYASGPTYANPMQNINQNGYSSYIGLANQFTISVTRACAGPKYNRPYKAAIDTITHQPFLIQWKNRIGSTAAYTYTDTTYTLYTENFNCTVDTPFSTHPIRSCNNSLIKVAYYVFKTTQESYVQINTKNYFGAVYANDVRTDSALYTTAIPVQPCLQSSGYIQLCKLQPGTYTLVIFANNAATCTSVQPTIYIDQVGYSRFDHAIKAYDFGIIPTDSIYHNGKIGDVNPLNSTRAPSNDFFYCTTGSQLNDPLSNSSCYGQYNPNIYNQGVNIHLYDSATSIAGAKRNLWYTFVIDKPGYVRIQVANKTLGKQIPFCSVFRSDVDGTLPFSSVVTSGQVDSTISQGLSFTTDNIGDYCSRSNSLSFYIDPCSFTAPVRYYIILNNASTLNSQAEVSILLDSIDMVPTKFDHHFQAYDLGNVGAAMVTGATDNFSCATRDATDPTSSSCLKTLWYKFTTTITGHVQYRIRVNGVVKVSSSNVQLFKEIVPGDSTSAGLVVQNYDNTTTSSWAQTCISPGTYYLLLPGCSQLNENVFPEVQIIEEAGDLCSRPVVTAINGAGTNVSSVIVNCHTIGTDYGEFNPTITCPVNGITSKYKSSWFRLDVTGNDTLDITAYISENTNVTPSDIKYRMMTGNCGAMQEQSCVLDAQTQNTYKCLTAGSYYFQVFIPVNTTPNGSTEVTGDIQLHLLAIPHTDTCAPINNCLSNANFLPQFNCNTDTAVRFINYSTYGSSIQYLWDFGYGAQISTAVSPSFNYPELVIAQIYNVTLKVWNSACNGRDSVTIPLTVPARPKFKLGSDTSLCNGGSLLLNATTWPGSTYLWNTGAITPTITTTGTGVKTYWVKATYNGCGKTDTIKISINPITPRNQTKILCGNDSIQLSSNRSQGETYLWNTGETTSSIYAKTPATYINTMSWNGCIIKDTFNVLAATYPLGNDTSLCFRQSFRLNAITNGATGYLWQNNSTNSFLNVTTPGLYWVQINFGNCNIRDTINLTTLAAITKTKDTTICAGQSYLLPSGTIVNSAGIYLDTLRSRQGCDSIISRVFLAVQTSVFISTNASICAGQSYTLPWGTAVTAAGTYRDTIRTTMGCDSIRRTIMLKVQASNQINSAASICAGQTYTLPSGASVSQAGTYNDTIHYASGCDSLTTTLTLSVGSVTSVTRNPSVCQGQSYTLPSGQVVSSSGTYVDTVRIAGTCDSVITTILSVKTVSINTLSPVICQGDSYTLPSGLTVNTTGIFNDTLRYPNGCDSIRTAINLTVKALTTSTLSPSICEGQSYTLPSGIVVTAAGVYRDTIRYAGGCDSLRSTINLAIKPLTRLNNAVVICAGQTYTLPSGTVLNTTGVYNDTLRYIAGCDSVIHTINLNVKTLTRLTANASICAGQTYTLPSGIVVNTGGIYSDTIRYIGGCDSLIANLNLTVKAVIISTSYPSICQGQSYVLPSGVIVTSAGVYRDTVKYTTGCDSLRSTINLTIKPVVRLNASAIICNGQSYTLPSGKTVNTPGIFNDTLRYLAGCDSIIHTINLTIKPLTRTNLSLSICEGQSYTLPSGLIVNTSGVYNDTMRYSAGCDSVITTVNLAIKAVTLSSIATSICAGQSYTLPSGIVVTTAGVYKDTVRYINGCDSLRSTITLSLKTLTRINNIANICQGHTYTLPSGITVSTSGLYNDTLRYTSRCDSVIFTISVTVKTLTRLTTAASLCAGQTYTLPSGILVNTTGTYSDTIRYISGCDSLITDLNLTIKAVIISTSNPSICQGQTYTLPSGIVLTAAGTYRDTVRYITGCDSLRSTVNLTIKPLTRLSNVAAICAGQTYTLPSGASVNATDIYNDTLRYTNGCDSVIHTISLTVKTVTRITASLSVCAGQTYILPSGAAVNTTGNYSDTIRYVTGCDSLISVVNLTVKPATISTINPVICQGQSYTLPSGVVVMTAGIFRDTIRYANGCDSLRSTINITIKPLIRLSNSASVCEGQTYTLPSGVIVNSAGIYSDTLHYLAGCDSIIYTINLSVKTLARITISPSICAGQSYTLPSGVIVTTAGIYRDTMRYISGCDSLISIINLTQKPVIVSTLTSSVCQGQSYILPSGNIVTAAGLYRDTVKYISGCDSLRSTVTLTIKQVVRANRSAVICSGQNYVLPSGTIVTIAGIYNDTLRYTLGCDSLITTVNLAVQTVQRVSSNASICSPNSYTMPSGQIISVAGIYNDTLRSRLNCDSLITTVNLNVTIGKTVALTPAICTGETYIMPTGIILNSSGIYRDTLRSRSGCDSIVTIVQLTVNPLPTVTIAKSNDINCILATSRLNAFGGSTYIWSPAASLSNATISNPVASPGSTTIYVVQVTSNKGCIIKDSIRILVNTVNAEGGFLVPSAFTPNNDAKNDCFGVRHWGSVSNLDLSVYDRKGVKLFHTADPSKCWDGSYNGENLGSGTYVYQIWATTVCGPVYRKGTVVLIR